MKNPYFVFNIMHWLEIIYFVAMTLAFIASFWSLKDRKYVLFIPLLALSLLVESLRTLAIFSEDVQGGISAFYTIAEYALLSYTISNFIPSHRKRLFIRSSVLVLVPLFIVIELTVARQKPAAYKYLTLLIENPFVCVWTIVYLFEVTKKDQEFEITRNPMFWISLGNLLFFSGSFFSYGFGSYLASKGSVDMAETLLWIARILNILLYILYFIGFICLMRKRSYW